MSRCFRLLLVALVALFAAGSSLATVIVDHVAMGPFVGFGNIGDLFTVGVRLKWDGQGVLQGVFSSTTFDSTVIEFVSATTAPASILSFTDNSDPENPVVIPGLSRLTTLLQQPGDPASVLRTVQYGAIDPVDARAATTATGRLIMTLTFRLIGAGVTNVSTLIANGDTGAIGDDFQAGTTVTIGWVPEPGSALLIGLGLGGLGASRRRGGRS